MKQMSATFSATGNTWPGNQTRTLPPYEGRRTPSKMIRTKLDFNSVHPEASFYSRQLAEARICYILRLTWISSSNNIHLLHRNVLFRGAFSTINQWYDATLQVTVSDSDNVQGTERQDSSLAIFMMLSSDSDMTLGDMFPC